MARSRIRRVSRSGLQRIHKLVTGTFRPSRRSIRNRRFTGIKP